MIADINYIKNIVENKYGITSPEAYINYKKEKFDSGLTSEEIEILSPDRIDSGSFWEYIEKYSVFNKDAVAYGFKENDDIEKVNEHNFRLACSMGALNYFFHYSNLYENKYHHNLLDIGAGYGMLQTLTGKITSFNYYGVDVYPKVKGIYKVNDCELPEFIMQLKFGLIIATNVFQHLSVRQRLKYYEQISQILEGVFSVSHTVVGNENVNLGFKCIDTGKKYACHYGQYTEIQNFQEAIDDISKYFYIISVCQRDPHNVTFHCKKRGV